MPIRFRCVYCDKLLGIARRKAGSVVNCPQCNQPLIVPTPEAEPAPAATAAGGTVNANPSPAKLFERDDFADLLESDATVRATEHEPRSKRSKRERRTEKNALPPQAFPVESSLPAPPSPMMAPLPYRVAARSGGMVLTTGKLILGLVVVFVLVGLAFGGGVLVGRMLN